MRDGGGRESSEQRRKERDGRRRGYVCVSVACEKTAARRRLDCEKEGSW